jgi:hypothetical protein
LLDRASPPAIGLRHDMAVTNMDMDEVPFLVLAAPGAPLTLSTNRGARIDSRSPTISSRGLTPLLGVVEVGE